MFISNLIHTVESYDPYGIHRLNGVKATYVLLILFVVNAIFYIPNPYFYFFYVPLTALMAEVVGETISDKYKLFIFTILGACILIFLFNVGKPYPLFFLFFSFLTALFLYVAAIHYIHSILATIPIILSLASYSLIYSKLNTDFYTVLNNAVTTLIAMLIICASLLLFPLSYYYRLWLRALLLLGQQVLNNLLQIHRQQIVTINSVQGHTRHVVNFANMLPRQLPIFSILKINLLINEMHIISCVADNEFKTMPFSDRQALINNFAQLLQAIKHEKSCELVFTQHRIFSQLVRSWNYLCLKQ